jgi:3',5'-cyclic AMP phosphodiesterase CpdA
MIYRLATFIQISDLHFGDIHPRTGEIVYDRGVRWAWSWFPACLGFAGHEARALIDLRDFFDEHFPAENDEPVALLVTGDLTSTGKREQFNDARQYLSEELEPPKGNSLGLNRPEWWDRAIPGNHDHWPGRPFMMGTYRTWVRKWRREFPYTGVPYELGSSGVRLRFMGINTDADIAPWSPDRFLARGNFISQLEALVEEMKTQPKDSAEIRVLLLHHSLAYRHQAPSEARTLVGRGFHRLVRAFAGRSLTRELEMTLGSRQRLKEVLAQLNISVILTGHTHRPWVKCFLAASTNPRRLLPCLEACCGTTTQATEVPAGWPSRTPTRLLEPNTLLVHRVWMKNKKVVWETETWKRDHYDGFVRVLSREPPFADWLVVLPRPHG